MISVPGYHSKKKDAQSVFEVILWGTEKHVLLMTSFYSQVKGNTWNDR